MDLKDLGLSVRVLHALERGGIYTVEDLIERKGELPSIRNCGAKAMKEIEEKLAALKGQPAAGESGAAAELPTTPRKSLREEIEEVLADRDRLESELEDSKAKLKALEPLEKFAAIQEEGKKLQNLIPWTRKITTELGEFKVEIYPGYLGGYLSMEFRASTPFVQSQSYKIAAEKHFTEKMSEVIEAINEALRRQKEVEDILGKIGDIRETILSMAKLLTYREKNNETQTVT